MGRLASRASARARRTIDQNRIAAEQTAVGTMATVAVSATLPSAADFYVVTGTGGTVTAIDEQPAGTVRVYFFESSGNTIVDSANIMIVAGTDFLVLDQHCITFRSAGGGVWYHEGNSG